MKQFKIGVLCLLLGMIIVGNAAAEKYVLVVPSASQEGAKNVGTYLKFFEGLDQVFKPEKIKVEYLYMDYDKATDDAARAKMAEEAIVKIRQKKPDVIVPVGDNCVKFVASKMDEIPAIFGFVYGDLAGMGLPKPNITGVMRRSYAADIWGLAHNLLGAKTVEMLSKDNLAMVGVKKILIAKAGGLEKLSGVKFLDMHLCNTIEEWQDKVKNIKGDFIYLADCSRILKDGKEMPRSEVVAWTVANSKVPVVAATGEDVTAGALYTILNSEKIWGNQTAELVLKFLNGTPIDKLSTETVKKGALIINTKTAVKYNVDIPYEILSSAEQIIE